MQFAKEELRKQYLVLRKKLSKDAVRVKSRQICAKLAALKQLEEAQSVSAYLPIQNEVDTREIINYLKNSGKKVFLPKFANGNWGFAEFTDWQELETGPYGIVQPTDPPDTSDVSQDAPLHTSEVKLDLNVAIIPGIAFDQKGVRLGYGKGVFDRLLGNSKAIKIGLAYDFQIVDMLPKEAHDLAMDLVITEAGVISDKQSFSSNK